jgi:ribosomal protein S6--L-glutamate ligase
MPERGPRLLGWREWVGLPALKLAAVKAKVDTGARTSTLHAIDVTPVTEAGRKRLRFRVLPQQERRDISVACVADLLDQRTVSSSTGQRELRWVIRTPLRIDGLEWPIELTLTDRGAMQFRMLLGRTALAGRFIVDPTRSFLLGPPK